MSNTNVGYIQFYIQFYLSFQHIISIKRWLILKLKSETANEEHFITGQQKPLLSDTDEPSAGTEREQVTCCVTLTPGPSKQATDISRLSCLLKQATWGTEEPPWRNTTSAVSSSHLLKLFTVTGWVVEFSWTRHSVYNWPSFVMACLLQLFSLAFREEGKQGRRQGSLTVASTSVIALFWEFVSQKTSHPKFELITFQNSHMWWLTTIWGSIDPPHPRSKPPAKDWL